MNCRSVTLEEFTTLMMGALSGRDPKETLWSVFTVLSRPEGSEEGEGLITLGKLKAVCKDLKVSMTSIMSRRPL
jgi:Ca2+-binding EF-hand superfamily protein